jgi:hypothetical protein
MLPYAGQPVRPRCGGDRHQCRCGRDRGEQDRYACAYSVGGGARGWCRYVDLVAIVAHPNVACLSSFGWIAGVGGTPSGVASGTGIMRSCEVTQHRGARVTNLSRFGI